jgi:tetratricopeptide (TPR) repeat protein
MTTRFLAIPFVSFLLCSSFIPACAQSNSAPPQTQPAAAASEQTKLSNEELARLYLVRKQYKEAQDIFHRLTVESPKNAVYWNELGISLHNQGDLAGALKCYQKSVKLDSHYADAQNNMGTIYYERKKYGKAIRAYNKAIALREDSAPFYMNLGYAYFGQKSYEESISAFRKALQIDPDAFESGRSRSGTIIQDRSISTDRAQFYFLLAKSFAEYGNVEHCILYLKKARDEGYKDMKGIQADPAFAEVIKDPSVQELLTSNPPETAQP